MWFYIKSAAEYAGPSPMFTWIHGTSRIELSGTSFLNAVSKASNFIVDGLEIETEQPVYVNLGNHWQSPVWTCAVLASGALLSDTPGQMNIVNRQEADSLNQAVVVSQDPFGMPEPELPPQAINASAEVRGFGDHFAPRTPTGDTTLLTTWGVDVQQAKVAVDDLRKTWAVAESEKVGVALLPQPHLEVLWHCFFSIFNRSPLVLLDGQFHSDSVRAQEHISHLIDLR